jgi:hypothetical protein
VHGEPWSQECVLHILSGGHSKKKYKKEEMAEPVCLFCLEDIKESHGCPNVVGCGCEVKCHSSCLQAWFEQKNQMECPICHHVTVMNPANYVEPPPAYVLVHVQMVRNQERISRIQGHEKCFGFCCLTVLLWWILALIFEYAF